MATWIVHLRLADALLGQIPGLDPAAFAVGNIAPDSGVLHRIYTWLLRQPPEGLEGFRSVLEFSQVEPG